MIFPRSYIFFHLTKLVCGRIFPPSVRALHLLSPFCVSSLSPIKIFGVVRYRDFRHFRFGKLVGLGLVEYVPLPVLEDALFPDAVFAFPPNPLPGSLLGAIFRNTFWFVFPSLRKM